MVGRSKSSSVANRYLSIESIDFVIVYDAMVLYSIRTVSYVFLLRFNVYNSAGFSTNNLHHSRRDSTSVCGISTGRTSISASLNRNCGHE